jgi:chemotaxis methyl-accepting protein methylase
MRTFHYALLPGGYLFLGTAESVTRNSRLPRHVARDRTSQDTASGERCQR